jgi:hypothetical protein
MSHKLMTPVHVALGGFGSAVPVMIRTVASLRYKCASLFFGGTGL